MPLVEFIPSALSWTVLMLPLLARPPVPAAPSLPYVSYREELSR